MDAVRAKEMFILPSAYVECFCYMCKNMHDIITITNKVGFLDIALAMTCNPQWFKTENALLPGPNVTDRLDLASRVSRIKLRALVAFLIEEKAFRGVRAYIRDTNF